MPIKETKHDNIFLNKVPNTTVPLQQQQSSAAVPVQIITLL
mgnify:CR=1 FL=1